eukprot:scaffold106253_cov30-Tisochrysis_lutea.AAC.2
MEQMARVEEHVYSAGQDQGGHVCLMPAAHRRPYWLLFRHPVEIMFLGKTICAFRSLWTPWLLLE